MKKLLLMLLALAPFAMGQKPIETLTDPEKEALRTGMAAQSSAVGIFERFGRHPEGTQISSGATAEMGGNWFITQQNGFTYIPIVSRALQPLSGDMIYIGGTVRAPDGRVSISAIVEIRANPNYNGTGVEVGGLTFGINSKPYNNLGAFLDSPLPIHMSIDSNGSVLPAIFYLSPLVQPDSGSGTGATGFGPPTNVPFLVNVSADGNLGTVTVSFCGRSLVYRDAGVASRIAAGGTGFFVEFGRPVAASYVFVCHSIWANAPQIDESARFFGADSYVQQFLNRTITTFPGKLRAGNNTFAANQGPQSSDVFATPGTNMLGYHAYTMPYPTVISQLTGTVGRGIAALSSGANATDATLFSFLQPSWLISSPANGAAIKATVYGRFGNNSNSKRIKIFRSGEPVNGLKFDSGAITPVNTAFKMEYVIFRQSSAWRSHAVLEYEATVGGGAQRVQQYHSSVYTNLDDIFAVSGVAAGDVTVDFWHRELLPHY